MVPNKANIRLWVDALRSGDYKQGTGWLYCDASNYYCCLGVAYAAASKAAGLPAQPLYGAVLPLDVKRWLGLKECDPELAGVSCITRNDDLCQSFETIADAIEKEYLDANS